MDIIPAIDLRGGNVVRLLRGEYNQETIYSNTPAEIAKKWEAAGAGIIHLVDLDGARDGEMKNRQAIQSITQTVNVTTELGGGLRDVESVDMVLDILGVDRAIFGSILLEAPQVAIDAANKYPQRIILGIDARDGNMATRGWRETSAIKATELVQEFAAHPFAAVIYTDIAKDGTLEGPNLDAIEEMAEVSPFPIIASGGIGSLDDIRSVFELNRSLGGDKITGIITGKAVYEGKFTVEQAIEAVKS